MIRFGVDYYPEQWPEERWKIDAQLMAEAGFNVVRLAEFAWARLEPREGLCNFDWLDSAIEILNTYGMQVILGTPTASPPPWVMEKYPDAYIVRVDGGRATYGGRREYCPNHPGYRQAGREMVTAMAAHYANHPAVIGWQIDNEFGSRCYCPFCAQAFHSWLLRCYGSLDELNERWGTIFWSHVYTKWSQIPPPLSSGDSHNPGLVLDFARFSSDSYVNFQQEQVDILRQKCPRKMVTHNFMGFGYKLINYFHLAKTLDLVSWDNYPRGFWKNRLDLDPSQMALGHDTMRGLKQMNFWVMEQQAGPSGWETLSFSPRPGELRLWAYQAIARGADGVVFFRWRTARYGTEQYWHGLLDHDGTPGRRYHEIRQMGTELKFIGDQIAGGKVQTSVAMLLSYDSRWAFDLQPNNADFDYSTHFHQIYHSLFGHNVMVDVVDGLGDLSGYNLVIAPALYVLSQAVAQNLRAFVQAGGVLVCTARTGVKDEANAVVNQRLPGLLADVLGIEVEDYDAPSSEWKNELEFSIPRIAGSRPPAATLWCDVLKPTTAQVVARYTREYYAEKPAITLNQYGKGKAIYVGTFGDALMYERMASWWLSLAAVRPLMKAPDGVEITERWQGDSRLLFILNHSASPATVELEDEYVDILSAKVIRETAAIPGRAIWILRAKD